ncbi:MAG: thioredoxin family protein [Phycisphaerae bacterium]|nr:thioredoxin family protein [Phycisphaerae bacterium]
MPVNPHISQGIASVLAIVAVVAAASNPAIGAPPESEPKNTAHVVVQAFADRQAISPSDAFDLVVSLKTDKDWCVYWQNPGGLVGLPTEIRWNGPEGYRVSRIRYPVPEAKFDKVLKVTSYVHHGTSLFITSVQVPNTAAPGTKAEFRVKASWLVCNEGQCIPGEAEVSLTLPVVAKGTKAPLANEALFEEARGALPEPTAKAEHVKLSGSIDKKVVRPGDRFTATLTAEIEAKHHMQSHKPYQEYLIPAVVFVERTEGLDIGEVDYPKPHEREDKILGKLSEYGGKITFKIPAQANEDAGKAPRWIRGVLQYQVCTDGGMCFRPQHVEFAIPVRIEHGAKPTDTAEGVMVEPEPVVADAGPTTKTEDADGSVVAAPGVADSSDGGGVLRRIENWLAGLGYLGVLALALIGGVVLNLMPCVLPVISLKVLSFVRQAKEDRARVFLLGLAYCAGILVFFGFIAILFWATGKGWGELFQSPYVVLALAAIVTAFAMSLFGVFAVFTPKVINRLGEKAEGEGLPSSFFTGVLATFLGTACTAPFLSAAVGAATRFPPSQGAMIFFAVGVGMALPFLVLSVNPGWLRFLPKPGPWMGTFEAVMGFLLIGAVIWLLNPLRGQLGDYGLLLSLIFLLAVAIAVWVKGKAEFGAPPVRRATLHAAALAILVLGWVLPFRVMATVEKLTSAQIEHRELLAYGRRARDGRILDWSKGIPWQDYKRELALGDVRNGYTVFVDYTADWCVNCKVNKKTSIEHPEVIALMKDYHVIPYEADYTLPVPEIKEDLRRFEKAGVPLYLVYGPGAPDNPQKLPEILTPGVVINALERAGPSKVRPPSTGRPTNRPAESE